MKIKVRAAKTLWEKIVGLIDTRITPPLLLYTRFGIHTFFVKNPIDIVVLDKNNRIKKLRQQLEPFRFYFYPLSLSTVLELPAGFILKSKLKINDKIELVNV